MNKRKVYLKPTTKIVEVKAKKKLLTASSDAANFTRNPEEIDMD